MTTPVRVAIDPGHQVSNSAKASAVGLVLTAAGMVLQIAGGSSLYPSFAGPIVLLVAALIVVLRPGRWTAYLALAVPLVLGVGAIIAAAMSGTFIEQLTDTAKIGVLVGSLLHVAGLLIAIAAAIRMVLPTRRSHA